MCDPIRHADSYVCTWIQISSPSKPSHAEFLDRRTYDKQYR